MFSLKELEEKTGVQDRTLRSWISKYKILPPALSRGRGSHYTTEHYERVLEIRKYLSEGFSLAEIKSLISNPVEDAGSDTVIKTLKFPLCYSREDLSQGYKTLAGTVNCEWIGKDEVCLRLVPARIFNLDHCIFELILLPGAQTEASLPQHRSFQKSTGSDAFLLFVDFEDGIRENMYCQICIREV